MSLTIFVKVSVRHAQLGPLPPKIGLFIRSKNPKKNLMTLRSK
jgi:hypothetical protein